ncbi:MAG: ComEC/Rec2 family competence protein [Flavobacteriaceae bacterium]|nr:ComEC/Rec2 family competence protein [Flavobacteriaceae bacterium]
MKKIIRYIPFQIVLFLSLGIVLATFFQGELMVVFGLVFSSLLLLGILWWKIKSSRFVFELFTYCCVVIVGVLLVLAHDVRNHRGHYSHLGSIHQQKEVALYYLKINKVLKSTLKTQRFYAEVIQLNNTSTSGLILLSVQRDSLKINLTVDDQILVKTTLDSLLKPLNPYVFDYSSYLHRKQIYEQLYVRKGDYISIKDQTQTFKGAINFVHKKINKELQEAGMSVEDLGFLNALLLGKRQFLSKDVIQLYATSGVIHVLAISGLHIGVLLLLLRGVFQFLDRWKYGKWLSSLCIVLLLWGFAILAGMSASVVRAVTMFTALQIGMSFNKRYFILQTIFSSMLILLIANPFFLFDVGFQLSYAAVLSIVLLRPALSDLWMPKNVVSRYVWDLVTVSLTAQLGVLPLSLFYFHQFPILFLISNLCIIPMLALLLFSGVFSIVFSLLGLPVSWFIALFSALIYYMNTIVNWVSSQSLFLIQHIHFSGVQLSISLCILGVFIFLIYQFKWRLFYLTVLLIFTLQMSLFYYKYSLENSLEMIVYHQYKKSKLLVRKGGEVIIFSSDSTAMKNDFLVQSYQNKKGIATVIRKCSIPTLFSFGDKKLFVVDRDAVYNVPYFTLDIVLLRASPKLNLERLISVLKPGLIIADGSNYPSYKKRWELICMQQKTPFHDTSKKGAYLFKE